MSLPNHFRTPEEYFEECLLFFKNYEHLFNFANTEILTKNVLENIKTDLERVDVKDGLNLETCNDEYLNSFFEKLKPLKVVYGFEVKHCNDDFNAPLCPKKKHEIVYLAREIKELCENIRCDVVVDFGCGLGYLDQQLFDTTTLKVLGLECNESHYVSAKKRQRKYHEKSIQNVKYIRHTVTEESHININGFLEEKFESYNGFCITGLHACADLTIDAMNLFLKMAESTSLILMPCCYHKMASNNHKFKNFPLSRSLKTVFERYKGIEYLRVPFLRLGSQPPNGGDKLEDLEFNLLARAVLEQYAQKKNYKLKRNKRKAVKTKSMANDFENYIQDASTGFSLIKNVPSGNDNRAEFDLEELRSLWRQIDDLKRKKAGVFVLLQNCLQPIIENLILFDRLIYLRENGIKKCRVKKIFDSALSPRCLAIIAKK